MQEQITMQEEVIKRKALAETLPPSSQDKHASLRRQSSSPSRSPGRHIQKAYQTLDAPPQQRHSKETSQTSKLFTFRDQSAGKENSSIRNQQHSSIQIRDDSLGSRNRSQSPSNLSLRKQGTSGNHGVS
jgi:hypothetical protein